MKKIVLFAFALSMMASFNSFADICIETDPDYDPLDCATNLGTVGTAIGITGTGPGPGPASPGVPIDGGLSIMLAVGGALGARRAFSKRKKENA